MSTTRETHRKPFVILQQLLPGMKATITVGTPDGMRAFIAEYDYMADEPTGNPAMTNILLTELPYNSVVKLETRQVIAHDRPEVGKHWPIQGVDEIYEVLAIEVS